MTVSVETDSVKPSPFAVGWWQLDSKTKRSLGCLWQSWFVVNIFTFRFYFVLAERRPKEVERRSRSSTSSSMSTSSSSSSACSSLEQSTEEFIGNRKVEREWEVSNFLSCTAKLRKTFRVIFLMKLL